jgi:hypothetical protein
MKKKKKRKRTWLQRRVFGVLMRKGWKGELFDAVK